MASRGLKSAIAALAASSMIFGSTAAVAATVSPVQLPSPWAVLTAMSGGAPAAAMCGAAATTAVQATTGCVLPVAEGVPAPAPMAAPVPVAPVAPAAGIDPLILGLIALAAGVGLYLALHGHGHGNSPA